MIEQELSEQKKDKAKQRELMRAQLLAVNSQPNMDRAEKVEKEPKVIISKVRPLQISTHYTEDDKDNLAMCAMNIRKNSDMKNPKNEEIVHAAVMHFLSLPLDEQITQLREDRKLLGRM